MHCHGSTQQDQSVQRGNIALVGHPNVGKSVIFQRLTGQHVAVANYPGTTIEIAHGTARHLPETTIIDTPGVITFPPLTDDEKVTARVLLQEPLRAILQVGDAKNLHRTLLLTVQLAEMGLPLVLALNMMDEATERGVEVNRSLLREYLDLAVVPTVATRGQGIQELLQQLETPLTPNFHLDYPSEVENALAEIMPLLPASNLSTRAMALFWLCHDAQAGLWLKERMNKETFDLLLMVRTKLQGSFTESLADVILQARLRFVEQVVKAVTITSGQGWRGLSLVLGNLTTHPFWGFVILAGVVLGLYWFVGVFGASTLVGWIETNLFGNIINPWFTGLVTRYIPLPILVELLVGEYGLWTMGMTYALALILPIVTTFFLAFGIMEDSGYLPRLAALSNRLFQVLGLNGKAVLPMVLGLGCVTMATLTTRVLENKRERLLVTLLLALAVPCSAQLGVVMGMLAGISFTATLIWSGVVLVVLLAVGWLAARLVPGERVKLLVELPPLRIPLASNVLLKTLTRLEWYLKEVVPLFLIGTSLLFVLNKIGVLNLIIRAGEPLVTGWLGLPAETSAVFLMGFLRRDFGATGLFMMEAQGLLKPLQVVVSMVTITLFIPCIASVMMIARERGWRSALGMLAFIFPLAFLVGGVLNRILQLVGWGL